MKCIDCKNQDATVEITKCGDTETKSESWTGEFCAACAGMLWKQWGSNPHLNWIFEELKQ